LSKTWNATITLDNATTNQALGSPTTMNDDEASTSRKRARQASYEKEQATLRDSFPALPDVTSGLLLQVFTDKSLARPASDEEELDESIYSDNQRLAMMGERVRATLSLRV
jgi:hypothetical protein